jgi:hypothetical protein
MQVIMESLIGWNIESKKQTNLGIFVQVLGFPIEKLMRKNKAIFWIYQV